MLFVASNDAIVLINYWQQPVILPEEKSVKWASPFIPNILLKNIRFIVNLESLAQEMEKERKIVYNTAQQKTSRILTSDRGRCGGR